MTREEAIRRYNETHTGGVQKSTPSISALSREEAIARYNAKQASKSWETRIGSIASREWQPPEYESYIPEEYKGKYEDFEEGGYGFDTVAAELKHNYGITPDKLENMTDEEKKLVTYLYTQDEPSLFEKIFAVKSDDKEYVRYAKELEEELERRGIERAAYEAQRNDGFWDKVGMSIGSVGNRVLGTFEGVDAIADALSGREVDETPFYTTLAEVKRQGVSEDMSGVGKFLYDVGMSWGDSMAMTGIGMLSGNPTAAKAISLIGMGSQAMSSTIADSKRRGMSDLQAIGNGILAGGIEAATEMIGIDALFDTRAFRNAFGKYLVKNVGANAGEEALAEVLGTVSDALVGQDKSRFMAKVREYQAEGYNESGAAAMAVLSVLGDTALAGLSGALMGLGSGTLGGAAQNVALNTRDVREGRAIRGLANAGTDLYGAARTMDNDKRIAATLKKLGEASSDSRSEAKLTGRLDRLAAEEYGRRSLEEYMTPEEINEQIKQGGADALKYYESRDDYKRAYADYAGKIDTAKRAAINAEASAAAAMVSPTEYGKRYKGELREVFDKGLAQYGGKKYKYPLWFEIAVSMGRQSGSRGLEEMLKTLPVEDRRGVLTLDNATIAAAFNEGRRIAAEYAEEQKDADERRKAGEMAEESRRKATAAEIEKKSAESEKNGSEGEDIADENRGNVLISDEVQKAKLTNSQQSQLKKLKRLGRYLDGYTFVVQFGHEGGKLGSQNAFFDPTNRTIYVNIEAGRQYRMTGDSSVELYEAALEAAWTHEIGHAIRMDAPTRYAELRDFIRTRLYREGGFENAVEKRRAQYESALGREIGYEYAEEEVICNSLGALMTSERLLNELAGKHRSLFSRLWRAVTEFFKSVMRRMRGMDGDFTAKTEEQRIVERALLRERRRLEDMFVGAMREANEVSRATLALNDQNKTTSDNKVAKSAENENVRTTDESKAAENTEKPPVTNTNEQNVKVTDGVKWSLSIGDGDTIVDIENTKDFLAIHNLTEKNLLDTLELGGFPMPSIAIIRGGQEHSKYGNISVVFGRETVDPKASSYNKIYGSDAWTPTYPRIEYKANPKVAKRVSDKYYELQNKYGYDAVRAMYSYATELEDRMNGLKGEIGLLEELYDSTRMMQIYLLDSGKGRIETIQKEIRKEMTASEIEMNEFFIKELGTEFVDAFQTPPGASPFSYRRAYVENNEKRLKEVFSKYLIEKLGIEENLVPNVLDAQRTGDYAKMLQNAYRYRHEGAVSIKTEDDFKATDEAIRKAADNEQYRDWIDSLFKGVQEKSGIRNSRDYYDSYGNSRSWEQLHYENTVDNVIRVMREQVETGGETIFSGNSIWGVAAKEYKSVDEMKSDKERLKILTEEEYKAMAEELGGRLEKIAQSIKRDSESNIFIAIDEAMQLIVDCVRTCKSRNSMLAYLRRYNSKATEKTVDDIISLVRDISNMPTGYFEAKPRRAVNFSEIKMVELPSHVSEHLKEELTERNIPFEIYGETDAERKSAIDSLEGVRFSLAEKSIKYPAYNEAIISDNMITLADMDAVASIDASKLKKSGKAPRELLEEYFASLGNGLHTEEFGYISLGKSSAKSEIRHGLTAEKIASIEAIPQVINFGKVIFAGEKHGSDVTRLVVAAPITIGVDPYYMGVMLQRDQAHQRLYLHNVLTIKEEATTSSQDYSLTNWSDEDNPRLFITSILQNAINVKLLRKNISVLKNISDTKKFSLRDKIEREELADRFDRIAETAAEREIVEKYKAEIEIADDAIDERRRVIKRLDEIEGKAGFGDERKRLRSELEHWNSVITGHDSRLFELEGFKPFRDMVERYEEELRDRHKSAASERMDESHMWISQAKYRELINRSRGERFYTQADAQVIEDKIYDMDKLSRSKRNKLVEALWQGMNAAKTEADVEGVIKSVGDLIFNEITRELTVENPEIADNAETLEYLSGYVQRLSFSEDMKEEIRHKYDEDGTRSFMGRWQNKHSDGRVVAADVFVTEFARENAGYEYLEDMPAADALFEIDALYDRMKNTEKRVGAYDDMTAEELSDVRRSIEQTLREAFRDGGEMPLVAKKSVSTEAMITLLKNQRDDAEAKVSEVMSIQRAKLMLSREANSIRDMKRGTFDNANEVRGTRVMELLRELGKFEYRGTFSEKDVREKVRGLYAWYTSPEADAVLGARGKDNDAASTNLRSAYIEEMLKDISLGEGRLTANELYGLAKILAAFRNIAKNYNKVWRAGKWVDALPIAEKYIGVLKFSRQLKGNDWFGKVAFRTYFDEFADPLSIVRRYDGYLEGGYFTDTFNMFREAAVNLEVTYSDVTKDYFEFFKKHKNYERDIQTRSVSIYGVDVPMKAAMSIYMMIRQDHALRGFVGQGVSFVGFNGEVQTARPLSVEAAIRFKIDAMARMAMEDYGLDEKTARANAESSVKGATWDSGNATIAELRAAAEPTKAAIEAAMTGEDRELIAIIGRDMNGPLRELKRTTDLERLGFTNVMEDSLYFPIKRSGIAEKVETLAYRDELESVSNISANKSREKGARQALFADDILKVYTRHARAICTYATMQQSIDFYNRIYNTSLTGDPNDNVKVGAVASEVWGKKQSGVKVENNGHAAFFRELIQDIQKLRSSRDNFLNNLLGGLRGGAAVAGIGLNGKVLMSQWFSFAAAAHELDIGSLIKGGVMWVGKTRIDFMTPSGWKRLRELGAIVDEYCPLARIRNEDNYAYLAQGVIEKGEGANVKRRAKGALGDGIKKLQEWSMWGIGRMDRAVICSLFEACKAEAVTADAPLGSEDNLVEAGRRLTEIILNTQQNALATEKSRAMRSEQEIIKAMTMFSSDAMKSNSRMLDAIGEARALRKRLTMDGLTDAGRKRLLARQKTVGKRVGKSVGVVMMNSVYMAALTLLFRWWRGKLEEDEEIFKSVALDVLTGMFGGLPLIRDIVDKLINGYDVTDSALDVLTDFLGTVKTLTETVTKVITGDAEWGDVVRSLRKLAFAYAQIVGLPVRNVWNGICGVIDKFNPELAKMLNG